MTQLINAFYNITTHRESPINVTKVPLGATAFIWLFTCFILLLKPSPLHAQSVSGVDPYDNRLIESVSYRVTNPSLDSATNSRVQSSVQEKLELFPGRRFSKEALDFRLAQVRRVRDVANVGYDISFGRRGGLNILVNIALGEQSSAEGRGMAFGDEFPVLYEKDGTYLRLKLDLFGLYYANDNAWYGRPEEMLAGNPLAQGTPSGKGYEDWLEAYVHYGIYGITPITENVYLFGGLSAITSGSIGQELFTDETRSHTGVEDAYAGIVGGDTDEVGNRYSYRVTVGRERFTLANGFLFVNTASSGEERAALQANARWAADELVLARFRYNAAMLEFFYLDPDELPIVDSETTYSGVNLEVQPSDNTKFGVTYVSSPKSTFNYFSPTGGIAGTREGLEVYDARFQYAQKGFGGAGWFMGAEYAQQKNRNFDMDARAGWVELGYSFQDLKWSPTISYRWASFSGDDPDTPEFERWDPLLSGGTGEQWVQGANHFKVVQDSNVIAHRVQMRFRPSPKIELVPQFWAFSAEQLNTIGGNPALTFLDDDEYGFEANLTAKWFVSRQMYVHGHVAYTEPGDGTKLALNNDADDWLSIMLFVRYAF